MQADLRGKVTREFEVSSSAARYHQLFAYKPYELTKLASSVFQTCKAIEGEFGKNGSVLLWKFTHEGKECVAKERIENCDAEKGTVSYRVIEGDFLTAYKYFVGHLHVTPRSEKTCLAIWTLEYEKLNEDVPDPVSFFDILVDISK